MKKSSKSRRPRQARSHRLHGQARSTLMDQVLDICQQLRESLLGEIRSAVASTARQLVQNEVLELAEPPGRARGPPRCAAVAPPRPPSQIPEAAFPRPSRPHPQHPAGGAHDGSRKC